MFKRDRQTPIIPSSHKEIKSFVGRHDPFKITTRFFQELAQAQPIGNKSNLAHQQHRRLLIDRNIVKSQVSRSQPHSTNQSILVSQNKSLTQWHFPNSKFNHPNPFDPGTKISPLFDLSGERKPVPPKIQSPICIPTCITYVISCRAFPLRRKFSLSKIPSIIYIPTCISCIAFPLRHYITKVSQ